MVKDALWKWSCERNTRLYLTASHVQNGGTWPECVLKAHNDFSTQNRVGFQHRIDLIDVDVLG
jgi:hypothetical protein